MDNPWFLLSNIIAILVSPLIASGITLYFTHKNDKRKQKLSIFEKLMTTRLNISTIDYVHALNLIEVVFYDSKDVIAEYKKLMAAYGAEKQDKNENNIRNLKLIEAIAKNLGYTRINWEDISKPYAPVWYYDELLKQEKYKGGQLAIADLVNSITKSQNDDKSQPEAPK